MNMGLKLVPKKKGAKKLVLIPKKKQRPLTIPERRRAV